MSANGGRNSRQRTNHYGLSRFDGEDRPSWLEDYNADMRDIDTAIKIVSNSVNNALPKAGGIINYLSVATGSLVVENGHVIVQRGMVKGIDFHAQGTLFLRDNGTAYIQSNGSQSLVCYASFGEERYGLLYGVNDGMWTLAPAADKSLHLGTPNRRWNQVYCQNAAIQTSDRTQKKDIAALDNNKIVAFVKGLQACQYKLVDGDSGRTHYGFVAQDVEKLMQELGMSSLDFAGFIKSPKCKMVEKEVQKESGQVDEEGNPIMETVLMPDTEEVPGEYTYGLRYEEFIPILWKYSQIMDQRQAEQDAKIAALEITLTGKIAELEAQLAALQSK